MLERVRANGLSRANGALRDICVRGLSCRTNAEVLDDNQAFLGMYFAAVVGGLGTYSPDCSAPDKSAWTISLGRVTTMSCDRNHIATAITRLTVHLVHLDYRSNPRSFFVLVELRYLTYCIF